MDHRRERPRVTFFVARGAMDDSVANDITPSSEHMSQAELGNSSQENLEDSVGDIRQGATITIHRSSISSFAEEGDLSHSDETDVEEEEMDYSFF